jgi:HAE1 family hydrophobic/amphiphilic exporter-1
VPAKFRESGREYDIRVRLKPEQRNLKENFNKVLIPNMNNSLVRLSDVAEGKSATTAASIDRLNRSRYVQVSGDVADGVGTNQALAKMDKYLQELKLPTDIRAAYSDSNYQDMISSFAIAIALGVVFIFLVLASLYESFITPFTIMLALPLAICGAFAAIYITNESLSLFAMLGIVMLLGVACKNSILLVDAARQQMGKGLSRVDALVEAGKIRLRPILMTSIALIAGTVPIAIGLNEASAQRVSMGYGIMGGLISSTLLTLIVVPAAFIYIDRFRVWSGEMMKRTFAPRQPNAD